MSLLRTSFLNGVAVVIKITSSLILNKILAIYVGPNGYAITGNFQNIVSILTSITSGVISNGITKTTAQHFDNEEKQHAIWKTALRFSLISSVLASASLLFFGQWIASWLFNDESMSVIFMLLLPALPAIAINNFLIAIINGKKEIEILVIANIIGSAINLLITGVLVFNFGLNGALVAYVINPAIAVFSTAILASRCYWFKANFIWGKINKPAFRELSGFGLMGLTSALTLPISYLLIRDHLIKNLGLDFAGYWQAMWGISGIYLMLVTSTLSVYYLPRLAEIRTANALKIEIIRVYSFVMPIVIISAVTIFVFRNFIVQTLFTSDFLPMLQLFQWQLIGDALKIGSWILGYVLVGRAMTKTFIATEIIFSISFVLLTQLLVHSHGLVGVSVAYAINYGLHWLCMTYIFACELRQMEIKHV